MGITADAPSSPSSGKKGKKSPSASPPRSPSTPPPEPTKAELTQAKRRATLAKNKEAARQAAQDRLVFGVPEEEPDPNAPIYCTCRKPDDGKTMVECGDEGCEVVWFHTRCVEEEAKESKDWICRDCKTRKTMAELWRSGVPGSLSHDDMNKIVPPPAEVLRAPAGDVYGLSSWKKDWEKETFGEEEQQELQQADEEEQYEEWKEYNENEGYDENEE